jgi:hypothetical protein
MRIRSPAERARSLFAETKKNVVEQTYNLDPRRNKMSNPKIDERARLWKMLAELEILECVTVAQEDKDNLRLLIYNHHHKQLQYTQHMLEKQFKVFKHGAYVYVVRMHDKETI